MGKKARIFIDAFLPLKNKNLSVYLGGQTVSLLGTMIQGTAISWTVWELSHSTQALGIANMLNFLPLLIFGAFAGIWADRLDRRKVLIFLQAAAMLLAFSFALLIQTGLIQVWHIYLLSLLLGSIAAYDMPVQLAFLGDVTEAEHVRAAVSLNNIIRQASRTVGPAIAGVIIGTLGISHAFWINGASFLAVIGSLLIVKAHQFKPSTDKRMRGQLKEGIQYIKENFRVQDLLIVSACIPFFAMSISGLLPAVVTDRLHAGAGTLGIIEAAAGAGAMAGSILMVPIVGRIEKSGLAILSTMFWIGGCFAIAPYSSSVWLWTVCVFAGSMASPAVLTVSAGLLQTLAPPNMKGRIMGIWMMLSFGLQPYGAILIGYLANAIGVSQAVLSFALAIVAAAALMLVFRSGFRNWKPIISLSNKEKGESLNV